MTASPIHVAPWLPTGRDHSATPTCWCSPVATYRDLATGAPVYRHRTPTLAPPRCRDQTGHRPDHRLYRGQPHCPRCEPVYATAVQESRP